MLVHKQMSTGDDKQHCIQRAFYHVEMCLQQKKPMEILEVKKQILNLLITVFDYVMDNFVQSDVQQLFDVTNVLLLASVFLTMSICFLVN